MCVMDDSIESEKSAATIEKSYLGTFAKKAKHFIWARVFHESIN